MLTPLQIKQQDKLSTTDEDKDSCHDDQSLKEKPIREKFNKAEVNRCINLSRQQLTRNISNVSTSPLSATPEDDSALSTNGLDELTSAQRR